MASFTQTTVFSSSNAQHKRLIIHHSPTNNQDKDGMDQTSDSNGQTMETPELGPNVNPSIERNMNDRDEKPSETNNCTHNSIQDYDVQRLDQCNDGQRLDQCNYGQRLDQCNNGQRLDQCNNFVTENLESTEEAYDNGTKEYKDQISSSQRLSPIGCADMNEDACCPCNQTHEDVLALVDNGGAIPNLKKPAYTKSDKTGLLIKFKAAQVSELCNERYVDQCNSGHIETENANQFTVPKYVVRIPQQGIVTKTFTMKKHGMAFMKVACSGNHDVERNIPSAIDATSIARSISLEIDGPETVDQNHGVDMETSLPPIKEFSMIDILLLFAGEDEETAHEFRDHLLKDIDVENLTVELMSDINCGKSEISTLDGLHASHINLLALITPNLKKDNYQRFVNEVLLVAGLKEDHKADRMIPVWTTKNKNIISEYSVFKGIDYFGFKSYTRDTMKESYKRKLKRMIIDGRNKFS
ncbi:hypothetical protein ACF0H5_011563 [Mactra antiquata]